MNFLNARILKRIGLGLILVQVLSYVFLSDMMLERKACDKYLEFTDRRFASPYNKNVSESIFVSSCGDEFFRDPTGLEAAALRSNPEYGSDVINYWDELGQKDGPVFTQYVEMVGYEQHIIGTISATTDTLETRNCIIYELCSTTSFPFYDQVQYIYMYSSIPTDYHTMMYTDRGLESRSQYVWLLFTWVEFGGELGNAF